MNYELYHDESLVKGYWHGMLLVPVSSKERLVKHLLQVRNNTAYRRPISLKDVRRHGKRYDTVDAWIRLGVAALMSRKGNLPYPIFLGVRQGKQKKYTFFTDHIAAKFILFTERDMLRSMDTHPDRASKIETVFRMGLKGGLHYLGCHEESIHIERIHFDGYLHLGRHVDKTRIVNRLGALRDYCSISSRNDLIDDRTGNHENSNCQSMEDCQLLQLTDLLVGAFRGLVMNATLPFRLPLVHPVRVLLERYQEGYARVSKSRWFNAICMSQCYLDNGVWRFDALEYIPQVPHRSPDLWDNVLIEIDAVPEAESTHPKG